MSLEKCMFFLPNRLSVQGNRLFVSFDVSSIPVDMHVSSMVLHVPLPAQGIAGRLLMAQGIVAGWDEQLMLTGYQPLRGDILTTKSVGIDLWEETVDLTHFQQAWRFNSYDNHGVYVELINHGGYGFAIDCCPFLIVATL